MEKLKAGQPAKKKATAKPADKKPETKTAEVKPTEKEDEKPVEQTDEQKAYVAEYNRYVELFGEMPNETLTTEQIFVFNQEREDEINLNQNPPVKPLLGQKTSDDDNFINAEKADGTRQRFNKITWGFLKGGSEGWKEIVKEPKEVEDLKNKKGNGKDS